MCIPVQKYIKFQYKNVYSSAEINIYSSKEICIFQKRNIYIPEQKYMFQYRVLSQYRYKYSSTELYLSTEIALPGSRLKYFPDHFAVLRTCLKMAAFCGKCGCMLLKSYFFAQSVEIKSRKLELLVALVVERRLEQTIAQALDLFPLPPFPISKHSESERKQKGVHSASERNPAPRSKKYKIQKSTSLLV